MKLDGGRGSMGGKIQHAALSKSKRDVNFNAEIFSIGNFLSMISEGLHEIIINLRLARVAAFIFKSCDVTTFIFSEGRKFL